MIFGKIGDFCFNIATAIFVGLFLDFILNKYDSVNVASLVFGGIIFMAFFIVGVLMYKKGG